MSARQSAAVICRMCHHPVTPENRRDIQRRVERRKAVSGRTAGYSFIHETQHIDCDATPEARAERIETTKAALRLAGVDESKWTEILNKIKSKE